MAEEKKSSARRGSLILMVISALSSVIIWTVLSLTAFPDVDVTLHDVPIDVSLEGSYADLAGLSIIEKDYDTVDITFTGRRDLISKYTADDIHIALDLTSVRSSGAYNIPLVATDSSGAPLNVKDMFPQTVHADFDITAAKTLSVEDGSLRVSLSGIRPAAGYALDPEEIEINPSSITIYGPQDYIDRVTSCVLSLEPQESLNSSVELTPSSVDLYSGSAIFKNQKISYSSDDFSVYIPVFYTKSLPLTIALTGYSDMIDLSSIHYTLSTESIVVRSEDRMIENLEGITLGTIDVRNIRPGYIETFEIPLSSYYTNISGIEQVEVRFDLEGYAVKRFTIPNRQIHIINGFSDCDMVIEMERLTVEVVGPEEVIDTLDTTSFVGQIDAMNYGPFEGQRMLSVSIYAPGHSNVWSCGLNQMLVNGEMVVEEPVENFDAGDGEEENG